jgi:II/X family phage/plasmid replication protein
MVDWLSVELPDPVGLPINDGHVCRVKPDGALDWSSACRKLVRGSHSSSMMFRALGAAPDGVTASGLEISGNPAKFLAGHNLFGSDCPTDLLRRVLDRVGPDLWPDSHYDADFIDIGEGLISRIDLTASWHLEREQDVLPFLRAMEERVWCPYRGRGVMKDVGTLYFGMVDKGKRAKAWQLKLYSKGMDIAVHRLPEMAYGVPGLLAEVNRTVRAELTLRSAELKRLGMRKISDWTPERVAEIWRLYVGKLDFGDATVNLDCVDLAELGLKPRQTAFLAAWKAGNDLRAIMSSTAFYRLRKQIRDATGHDIATCVPKSNVVPLRRFITASPAGRPVWADALTQVLAQTG